MTRPNPVESLFNRLSLVGIAAPLARQALPCWWDDEIATIPSGLQQAQMYLARVFNISLASLADTNSPVIFLEAQKSAK